MPPLSALFGTCGFRRSRLASLLNCDFDAVDEWIAGGTFYLLIYCDLVSPDAFVVCQLACVDEHRCESTVGESMPSRHRGSAFEFVHTGVRLPFSSSGQASPSRQWGTPSKGLPPFPSAYCHLGELNVRRSRLVPASASNPSLLLFVENDENSEESRAECVGGDQGAADHEECKAAPPPHLPRRCGRGVQLQVAVYGGLPSRLGGFTGQAENKIVPAKSVVVTAIAASGEVAWCPSVSRWFLPHALNSAVVCRGATLEVGVPAALTVGFSRSRERPHEALADIPTLLTVKDVTAASAVSSGSGRLFRLNSTTRFYLNTESSSVVRGSSSPCRSAGGALGQSPQSSSGAELIPRSRAVLYPAAARAVSLLSAILTAAAAGTSAPSAVLLHGPPQCGKSMCLSLAASRCELRLIDFVSGQPFAEPPNHQGALPGTARGIVWVITNAEHCFPSDDPVAARVLQLTLERRLREGSKGHHSRHRVVAIVAVTTAPFRMDPSVRDTMLPFAIEVPAPDTDARRDIFHAICDDSTQRAAKEQDANWAEIAERKMNSAAARSCPSTHDAVERAAKLRAELEREWEEYRRGGPGNTAGALPAARGYGEMDEIWGSVGGYDEIKRQLWLRLVRPLQEPATFRRFQLHTRSPRGVLLHGPPGCGKTSIARALCQLRPQGTGASAKTNPLPLSFFLVDCASLLSAYVGEAESRLRAIFSVARSAAPCMIVFDEVEAIATARGSQSAGSGRGGGGDPITRLLSTLLTEMDGISSNTPSSSDGSGSTGVGVTFVGLTNVPHLLDPALLRPGRLDCHFHVPLPTRSDRKDILRRILSRATQTPDTGVDHERVLEALAEQTEGCSGADIAALGRSAALSLASGDLEGVPSTARHEHSWITFERMAQSLLLLAGRMRAELGVPASS